EMTLRYSHLSPEVGRGAVQLLDRHGNGMATGSTPSANQPKEEEKMSGGGGNRTRVRKHSTWSHYMLSPCFSSSGGRPWATCLRTIPEWISSGAVRAPRRTSRLFWQD